MNLQSLDLNLLLAFETLMIESSVTRAAKRLNLSQPAMSNAPARRRRASITRKASKRFKAEE